MERELVDGGEDNLGQIPFRCLLEQMLYSGATNDQIYNELATFFAAVWLTATIKLSKN